MKREDMVGVPRDRTTRRSLARLLRLRHEAGAALDQPLGRRSRQHHDPCGRSGRRPRRARHTGAPPPPTGVLAAHDDAEWFPVGRILPLPACAHRLERCIHRRRAHPGVSARRAPELDQTGYTPGLDLGAEGGIARRHVLSPVVEAGLSQRRRHATRGHAAARAPTFATSTTS